MRVLNSLFLWFLFVGSVSAETVEVPPFVNVDLEAARETAQDLGIVLQERPVFSDQPIGLVLSQIPVSGSLVPEGSPVVVDHSVGLTLPNVNGYSLPEAIEILDAAGFAYEVTEESECSYVPSEAFITSQYPNEIAEYDVTQTVIYLRSSTPPNRTVPDVVGLKLPQAEEVFSRNGLNLEIADITFGGPHSSVYQWCQSIVQSRTVTSNGISPGTLVCAGTTSGVNVLHTVDAWYDCRACPTCPIP